MRTVSAGASQAERGLWPKPQPGITLSLLSYRSENDSRRGGGEDEEESNGGRRSRIPGREKFQSYWGKDRKDENGGKT